LHAALRDCPAQMRRPACYLCQVACLRCAPCNAKAGLGCCCRRRATSWCAS
jgi:hypothetical protein